MLNMYDKKYYDGNKQTIKNNHDNWRKKYPHLNEKDKLKIRERTLRRRKELISFLGGECVHCGISDTRCLQFDHKHGGGCKEVKLFKGQKSMFMFYYRNPHIAQFKLQILCANCNSIKRIENKEFAFS